MAWRTRFTANARSLPATPRPRRARNGTRTEASYGGHVIRGHEDVTGHCSAALALSLPSCRPPPQRRCGRTAALWPGGHWLTADPTVAGRPRETRSRSTRGSAPRPDPRAARRGTACLLYTSDAADEEDSVDL